MSGFPRTGLTVPIQTRQIPFAPTVPNRTPQEVLGVIRNIGIVANAYSREEARERYNQRVQDTITRGNARSQALAAGPLMFQEIDTGEWAIGPDEDVREQVNKRLDEELDNPEYSDVYRKEFRDTLESALIERHTKAQNLRKADQLAEDKELIKQSVIGENDPKLINGAVSAIMTLDPTLNENEAIGEVAVPSLQLAAALGDKKAYDAALGIVGDAYPIERAKAKTTFEAAVDREEKLQRDDFFQAVDDMRNAETPLPVIEAFINNYDVPKGVRDAARAQVKKWEEDDLHKIQKLNRDRLANNIYQGRFPDNKPMSAVKEVQRRMDLDPTNPNYIQPDDGRQLINSIGSTVKSNAADEEVARVFSGAQGNLWNDRHGKAVTDLFKQSGLLDQGNRIANVDPNAGITPALQTAGFVPTDVRNSIYAALRRPSDPQSFDNAVAVIGQLAQSDLALFQQIRDNAPGEIKDVVNKARDSYATMIQDDMSVGGLSETERERLTEQQEAKPKDEPLTEIERNLKIDEQRSTAPQRVMGLLRKDPDLPQLKNFGLFGIGGRIWLTDILWGDPLLSGSTISVTQDMKSYWFDQWRILSDSKDPETAIKLADEETAQYVKTRYDYVRVKGRVTVQNIVGFPEEYRWKPNTEEKAKAELKAQGCDWSQVVSMKPIKEQDENGNPVYGWTPIDEDGNLVLGEDGMGFKYFDDPRSEAEKELDERAAGVTKPLFNDFTDEQRRAIDRGAVEGAPRPGRRSMI